MDAGVWGKAMMTPSVLRVGALFLIAKVGVAAVVEPRAVRGDDDIQLKITTPAELAAMDQGAIPTLANGIPKILHQTWRSHELLPQHRSLYASWDKFLPDDWIHVLWTDDEAEEFVRANAPAEFLETYDLYVYPIERIDTFRYVLLSVYGGIYADLDNELFAAPELPNIERCKVYLAEVCCGEHTEKQMQRYTAETKHLTPEGPQRPVPQPVQNSLMVSTRGHPFWRKLLHLAIERGPANSRWQRWTGLHQIHRVVGVDLLSSANYLYGADSVCQLGKEDWHGGIEGMPDPRFVKHHGTHVWKTFKHNLASIVVLVVVGLTLIASGGYCCLRLTGNDHVVDAVKTAGAKALGSVPVGTLRAAAAALVFVAVVCYMRLEA